MTIQEQNGCAVLQPEGDLTIFEAAEFRDALVELSAKKDKRGLSLAKIERIDSSCVQLVVAACQEMALHISDASSSVREQFDRVGCGKFLNPPAE